MLIMHEIVMTKYYQMSLVTNNVLLSDISIFGMVFTLNHNFLVVNHSHYFPQKVCHIVDMTEVNTVFHLAILVQY